MCVCVLSMRRYVCMYMCEYICMQARIDIYTYLYIYVYMYIFFMFDSCAGHIMSEAPQSEAKEKDILQAAYTLELLKKVLNTSSE